MITPPPFYLPKGLDPKEIRRKAEFLHQEKGGDHTAENESVELKALVHELEVHQIELEIQKEELELAYETQANILEEYSNLYDFSPVGYLSLHPEGTLLNLNLRAATILDRNRSELLSTNLYDSIDAADRARFDHFLKTLPSAPEQNAIELKLNGAPHFVEVEGFIAKNSEEIRLVMTDRTRARTSEAENRLLMTAMEGSSDTIVITDPDANIEYVNQAFEKLTGYSKQEVSGKNPRILQSGNHTSAFYQDMWDTLTSRKTWEGTIINKTKEGSLIEEEASISPVLDHLGNITHYVSVKRNVTLIRSLEAQLQQAQKMEAIGRLAGGVAHDFNNLLTAMLGYCELCKDELSEDHPIQEYLTEINLTIARATQTTGQLLVFAREHTVHPVEVDLNERITFTYKLLHQLLGESFPLEWTEKDDPLITLIDPIQLDQILANLCINAKDAYKEKGGITLKTGRSLLSQKDAEKGIDLTPGPYVWLSVSDKGSGMDEETQRHIFEPFYTTKDIGKGTGLGLSIVYGILKKNNGYINVDSRKAVGTTFTLFFPELVGKKAPPLSEPSGALPRGEGQTLLVVDDEKSIRNTLKNTLEGLGYNVVTAASPREALNVHSQHLTSQKFPLVLSDIMMPGMTGIEMTKIMKERQPDLKVVLMTGHHAISTAEEHGATPLATPLQKPFTRITLANRLKDVFDASTEV